MGFLLLWVRGVVRQDSPVVGSLLLWVKGVVGQDSPVVGSLLLWVKGVVDQARQPCSRVPVTVGQGSGQAR